MRNMWYQLEADYKSGYYWLKVRMPEGKNIMSTTLYNQSVDFTEATRFTERRVAVGIADLVSQLSGYDVFVYQVWGEVGEAEDKMDEIRLVHSSPQYAIPF